MFCVFRWRIDEYIFWKYSQLKLSFITCQPKTYPFLAAAEFSGILLQYLLEDSLLQLELELERELQMPQ
jgi:hypothetical protein